MISKNVTIMNKTGIHARPASMFVQAAAKFKSNVTVEKEGRKGNAKSMLNILALSLSKGSTITIWADGEDEAAAVDSLVKLVESKFGEE